MIKRIALILGLGLIAVFVMAGDEVYDQKQAITITGDNSTAVDSFPIFNTMHYGNRYWMTIEFDSVTQHGEGSTVDSFGLRDSIFVVIRAEYAGQIITLDSTEDSLFDANTLTLNFTGSGAGDSIQGYGEHLWVWVRIADTVSLTTDSVATFNFRISSIHLYQD